MGRKRRQIGIDDPTAWIFNRMAEVYDARPPYPAALLDAQQALAPGRRILDLGAGTGHFALPLAARGFEVVAVEPARAMLTVLERTARARGVGLGTVHARAEELPFGSASFDLVLIADALHFLDVELTAAQIRRVLAPRGVLSLVTSEFADTPFMRAVRAVMEDCAPRRPRAVAQAVRHVAALAWVELTHEAHFADATPVDAARLEAIVRSVSFIGPAMNPERFEAFLRRLHAIPHPPVWARRFTVVAGRRHRTPCVDAARPSA